MLTSMTVGPFEAHAGASWVSGAAACCAAEVTCHPVAPILPFPFPLPYPSCIKAGYCGQALVPTLEEGQGPLQINSASAHTLLAKQATMANDAACHVARQGHGHFSFLPGGTLQSRLQHLASTGQLPDTPAR